MNRSDCSLIKVDINNHGIVQILSLQFGGAKLIVSCENCTTNTGLNSQSLVKAI